MQSAQERSSSLHWNPESASLELKVKLAKVELVSSAGLLSIEVWGGLASAGADGSVGAGGSGVVGVVGTVGVVGVVGVVGWVGEVGVPEAGGTGVAGAPW